MFYYEKNRFIRLEFSFLIPYNFLNKKISNPSHKLLIIVFIDFLKILHHPLDSYALFLTLCSRFYSLWHTGYLTRSSTIQIASKSELYSFFNLHLIIGLFLAIQSSWSHCKLHRPCLNHVEYLSGHLIFTGNMPSHLSSPLNAFTHPIACGRPWAMKK